MAGLFDGLTQLTLVSSTSSDNTARNDFAAFRDKIAKGLDVFIVDNRFFVGAESADLLAGK